MFLKFINILFLYNINLFEFLFLLQVISKSISDVIVNTLALTFILELDNIMINCVHDLNVIKDTARYANEEFKKILDVYTLHELEKNKLKLSNYKSNYQKKLKIKNYFDKRASFDKETALRNSLTSSIDSLSISRGTSFDISNEDVNRESINEEDYIKHNPYNISTNSKLFTPQQIKLSQLANNESCYLNNEETVDINPDLLVSRYLKKVHLIKEVN